MGKNFSFSFFFRVARAHGKSTEPIQMKSSMTFIRSNRLYRERSFERKMAALLVLSTRKFKSWRTNT